MKYRLTLGGTTHEFRDLKTLLARGTPLRSGDQLAGVAAASAEERVAAQMCLAEVPLTRFLEEPLIPAEEDEVTRLILAQHDRAAFAPVAGLSVGELRNWLLRYETDTAALTALAPGLTPEMVAAVSKLMSNQDLILVASKTRVVTKFRNTLGLPGTLAVRLQPNHPTDDPRGIAASILDGLMYGCGDAVIGINPATDSPASYAALLGAEVLVAESAARDRAEFLQRPDLGRRLGHASRAHLVDRAAASPKADLAIIISDGLSTLAANTQSRPLLDALLPLLRGSGWSLAPLVVVRHARVALQDEVGEIFRARISLMLLGERPGLGNADSLGAYFTFDPAIGRTDADRNCISNIRPGGLVPADAAVKLHYLLEQSRRLALSGVALKDDSPALGGGAVSPALGQ